MILVGKTAWILLNRLAERSRDLSYGEAGADDAMLKRFIDSDWANMSEPEAGNQNTGTHLKKFSITENGRRILRVGKMVEDSHPDAAGLR